MNLVDSCGWLEYFSDAPNADTFAQPLGNIHDLLVPSIVLYEVFKVVLRERGEDDALQAVALMRQGLVVELTESLAIYAAKLSLEHKMPMADSIIYATAKIHRAVVWTQDQHFRNLSGVNYVPPHAT